jgi:hypothetical protein
MGKKYFRDWQNFVDSAGELLNENMRKCRVTLKYRNKLPSYGKLYVTDDNKSKYIKLDKKSDLDKIEIFFKGVLHMMANKPIEQIKEASKTESKNENKKKSQKRKK